MPQRPVIPAAPTRNGHLPPDGHMPAVVIALFVCLPLGLVALWHSRRIPRCWQANDREGARRASLASWAWCVRAFMLPTLLFVLFMAYWGFWGLGERYRTYAFYEEMNELLHGSDSEQPCEDAAEAPEDDSEELEEEGE